jgi:hypothetical protein
MGVRAATPKIRHDEHRGENADDDDEGNEKGGLLTSCHLVWWLDT